MVEEIGSKPDVIIDIFADFIEVSCPKARVPMSPELDALGRFDKERDTHVLSKSIETFAFLEILFGIQHQGKHPLVNLYLEVDKQCGHPTPFVCCNLSGDLVTFVFHKRELARIVSQENETYPTRECPRCKGHGGDPEDAQLGPFGIPEQAPCRHCDGEGVIDEHLAEENEDDIAW